MNANDADEIVVVGHSGGAPLVQCIIARALELDQDLGRRGPRIVPLTIGSITPAVALHPRALKMRRDYSAVSNRTLDNLESNASCAGIP